MKFAKSMLGLVLAVLLCVSMARAQENAELSGTVTDPTGAVIPNAKVTITNVATGESRTVTSNGAGLFDFSGLNHGTYNMKVEAEGFNSFQRSNIVMNVAQTVQENAVLQVGAGTQTVTVEADTVHLQTETNEVSNLITGQQMTQLATNGRNMVSLTTLGTGVSNNLPSFNGVTAQGSGFGLSFNGMRPDHNDWLIDGGEAYDRGSGGKFDLMPSMDVLAEFQTLSSNYSPDYGISSGGTVTMVLKSGTKQFHGGLWEFNRNDAFDSDYFFAKQSNTPTPELRLNIFGGDIGGPVFIPGIYPKSRSKTFFFESEEWRRFI
ncbi:MAG: TonB-dependent receptor [Terracidiphilus sp.]